MFFFRTRKQKIWSAVVVIYNLLGLIGSLGTYPDDIFYTDKTIYLEIITMPIAIISSAYRYVYAEPVYPIFIIQGIVLAISLFITNYFTKEK